MEELTLSQQSIVNEIKETVFELINQNKMHEAKEILGHLDDIIIAFSEINMIRS